MPTTALKVSQSRGTLKGEAPRGASIEAINLSTIPNKRLHGDDTFVLAKAGADGSFSGKVPDLKPGDYVRLRARTGGKTTPWVTLRATGTDTRNAEVALFRIGLKPKGGTVDVANINSSRPISEPGARLLFTNQRTGDKTLIVLDDEGTFAKGTKLDGEAGDVFAVAVSDGKNNKSFKSLAGTVKVAGRARLPDGTVDLADPKPDAEDKDKDVARFTGPLKDRAGMDPTDVVQGNIGDCYVPSAAASLVDCDRDLFEQVVTKLDDGSYSVRFKVWDDRRNRYVVKRERVDADLYVRSFGGALYGADDGDHEPSKMELWWAVFEKGYAQLMGGYHVIGKGGSSADVFSAVLGRDPEEYDFKKPEELWTALVDKKQRNLPVSLGTYSDRAARRYVNTGVFTDHSYSVLDVKKKADGTRWVQVRNPWGESEPYPGDGKDDGIFWLKLEDAARLFRTFYSVV